MKDENTILEIQMEVSNLMNDLESRIHKVYDKYTVSSDIPKLPPYEKLKDERVRYECSRVLTDCVDELNEMSLRVTLLRRNFERYQNFSPASKTEYIVVSKFKESLKSYVENLTQYSIDLSRLISNANSKLRKLEAADFYNLG